MRVAWALEEPVFGLLKDARRAPAVPVLAGEPRTNWEPPRMRVALAAGYYTGEPIPLGGYCPLSQVAAWVFVARGGRPTGLLADARLFPYSRIGSEAAFAAARRLLAKHCPEAYAFTLRVVVTGDQVRPEEITEAWRLEGEPSPHSLERQEPE